MGGLALLMALVAVFVSIEAVPMEARAQAQVEDLTARYQAREREVIALVEKAAATFREKGKDYTIKLLNAESGPFMKGEVYVFSMNFGGVYLSYPTNKALQGALALNLKDPEGKTFIQDFIKIAKERGSGWVEYWWIRHGETVPTLKRAYILKVPGEDILVGAGYYLK